MQKFTFIDLFCGCGGFSLGLERAGLSGIAAIDFNDEAIAVHKKNLAQIPYILNEDVTKFMAKDLAKLTGINSIDVIVGGPPCQGFSTVRQVDGANHGERLVEDKRRYLYQEFLRYVEFFRPKVFVMENVLGIRSASGGEYFTRVQKEARASWIYRTFMHRLRIALNLAYRKNAAVSFSSALALTCRIIFTLTIKPARPRACDRPSPDTVGGHRGPAPVKAGGGNEISDYDNERRKLHVKRYGGRYLPGEFWRSTRVLSGKTHRPPRPTAQ